MRIEENHALSRRRIGRWDGDLSEVQFTMGYPQWIGLTLHNLHKEAIYITGVGLFWGKLYRQGNKDEEVPKNELLGVVIEGGAKYTVWACGRSGTSSGTEGQIELSTNLLEPPHKIPLVNIYWSVPWGSSANRLEKSRQNEEWLVDLPPISQDGAIGEVTVRFQKIKG